MLPDKREAGFTLIEVIVALLVTAFLLAVISSALETSRAREIKIDQQARALLIGEEAVARRAEERFQPGEEVAERGKYAVRISEAALQNDPRRLFVLSEIGVAVSNDKDQLLYRAQLRRLKALPQ